MASKKRVPPTGEVRQSQLLTTYGPGSMVDLPDHSVLVGGLEHWRGDRVRIYESRLEAKVAELLEKGEVTLQAPPVSDDTLGGPQTGISAFVFPQWFLGQVEQRYEAPDGRSYRTRPLVRWNSLVKGGYLTAERKVAQVVPVRFVQACPKGHLSDIDWYAYVHNDPQAKQVGQLWLDEGGAGNDFSEIFVRSEHPKMRRALSDAKLPGSRMLGTCQGRRPWLGPNSKEACKEANRLLPRSASNAYFSQTVSAISIPDSEAALKAAVASVYQDFLKEVENAAEIKYERKKEKVKHALEGYSDERVWEEVQRLRSGTEAEEKKIRQVEIETLLSGSGTIGEDKPDSDFFGTVLGTEGLSPLLADRIERIVLVERLREVVAQVGFTRLEPATREPDGDLSLNVELASLSREANWVPAMENRGEGVFIAFKEGAIRAWLKRAAVKERGRQLVAGAVAWADRKDHEVPPPPEMPYLMLHSLAHLLITSVSLECGYSASSIKERVYAGEWGHGILLYTGSAGSEGTLGGLVEVGRNLGPHLTRALELGRLCSNDPPCAEHDPANPHEERFLHGAACHGCLLIAETSCERRNEHLDRALVVPTVTVADAAFFDGQV